MYLQRDIRDLGKSGDQERREILLDELGDEDRGGWGEIIVEEVNQSLDQITRPIEG